MSPENDVIRFTRMVAPRAQREDGWVVRRAAPEASLASIDLMRVFVREFCEAERVATLADTAQTVMTELITNAVIHARGPLEVWCARQSERLYVAVGDCDPTMPRIGANEGLGLLLVDSFSTRWGVEPVPPVGKVVWAIVDIPSLG